MNTIPVESLIANLRSIVLVLDVDARIALINPYFEKLTGYKASEVVGRDWFDTFIPPEQRETIRDLFATVLGETTNDGYTNPILAKSGELLFIEWHSATLEHKDGEIAGLLCTGHDVTERIAIASQLQAARDEAEQANAVKTRFLAAASHDLRQPLQSINLYLSVLDSQLKDDATRAISRKMRNSLDIVGELLDALLNISKLDSGSVTAEKKDFLVRPLLERIITENFERAKEKGLHLSGSAPECVLHSDPGLLERIIDNFVTNAIRYTEQGEVRIICTCHEDIARISVIDTGIGIAEEELENIFEEYFQLDNDVRNRHKGLGLGLSIVKHIARLLDHEVKVESVPGDGSCFSVEVPMSAQQDVADAQPTPVASSDSPHNQPVVMFVDDDPAIVDGMAMILSAAGITFHTALSGDEAMKHISAGIRPDLLVSDYRLPGYNGVELVRRIRKATVEDLPTVIMTGDTSAKEIEAAGLPNCKVLHKPVDVDELVSIIQSSG